jgi:hypothetical protein
VGRVSVSGRSAASDAPLELRFVTVVYFHEGQVMRASSFLTQREALESVGQVA